MTVIAIQTARAGSKSVIKKNELDFKGQPLFTHNLNSAVNCKEIDHVFCSTDIDTSNADEFLNGVRVLNRPSELATDDCSHFDTIRYALSQVESELSKTVEIIVVMLGNSISSFSHDLSDGINRLRKNENLDSIISVAKYNMFNPLRAFSSNDQLTIEPIVEPKLLFDGTKDLNDKDILNEVFFFNGGFWIIRRDVFLSNQGLSPFTWLGKHIGFIEQDAKYQEIDANWQTVLLANW